MNIAILMMQKNESELLEKWLRYHGHLVGFDNLYVYDNGSSENQTHEVCDKYQKLGVNVDRTKTGRKDFERKGHLFLEKIKSLQDTQGYDFYIPLDCDEFLGFVDQEGHPSCDRDGLSGLLHKYIGKTELLLIDSQFYNSSASTSWFNKQPYRKCFFYKNTIKDLDVGFHWGKVNGSNDEFVTRLIHFHFHNKPFSIGLEHAKEKLKDRVGDFDLKTLRNYKGAGLHLIRFFTQDEKNYVLNQFNQPHMYSDALRYKFNELGISWPYSSEIAASVEKFDIDVDSRMEAKEPEYFHGSIDYVGYSDDKKSLFIKGWGIFQLSQPPESVYLEVENGKQLHVNIVKRFAREDVSSRLRANKTLIGFEGNVVLSGEALGKFTVKALSNYKAEYFNFDINRKYRDVLSS